MDYLFITIHLQACELIPWFNQYPTILRFPNVYFYKTTMSILPLTLCIIKKHENESMYPLL